MNKDKSSIILDDKNLRYPLICRLIDIVKDRYKNVFKVSDLSSWDELTNDEKKYLRKIFAHDITELYLWEHRFYIQDNAWHYDELKQYDYRKTIRHILLLLNKGKISMGEKINTNDYQLIKSICYDWFGLLDNETRWLYKINFSEEDFVLFISHNLKNRLGDTCIYNFEFFKTFMEAKKDYHAKKLLEAILCISQAHLRQYPLFNEIVDRCFIL